MNEIFWLCAMSLFLIVEAVTVNMVSIWFAIGSVAAAVAAFCGAGVTVQVLVFAVVSALTLLVFKKFFADKMKPKAIATNADRVIGADALVVQKIDPIEATGEVSVKGQIWSAKSDLPIEKGEVVEVVKIEGVKLIVKEKVKVD